ncbi:class I SAM-dependent methyltransferase [Rhizophagus clarus]|uniref:Class I SAM-dependent methyltransferase n=1 Tax=Rhizophagus clarus TaxID=94130 RepID=A0A8H3KZD5_9GLOM|nr:class I SAM-dependent methyltransferase [Rhizophagus clarus]
MGGRISKQGRKPFFIIKKKKNGDGCPMCPNNTEYAYADTIRDANFSWLEGRSVSADDFYPVTRHVEGVDHVCILMHDIYKYILRGNTKTPLTSSFKRCLHIGSGHYIWLIEMANENSEIQFEGFDLAPKPEIINMPKNATFTHGNIFDGGLPYPDEYFDYVNVRSFLTWLPSDKISFVIKEIRRVLKRGGRVEILETDIFVKNGTLYYEENLGKIWKELCNFRGYDATNIIRLDRLLLEKGFSGIKMSKLSIPLGYGGDVGDLYAEVFITATMTIASVMMEKLNMTKDEIQEYLQS